MGEKTTSMTGGNTGLTNGPEKLRAEIADTRNDMSNTIEELHGRLNPAVLKDQVLEQFHEAADTVKSELKAHFKDAKEAMRAELKEAKQNVRTELMEAKAAIKSEVLVEIEAAKTKLGEEISHAKAAVREATIGKVEHMIDDAQGRVRDAGNSLVRTVKENPIPATLIGVGLAWLLLSKRRKSGRRLDAGEHRGRNRIIDVGSDGADEAGDFAHQAGRKIADAATGAASAVGHLAHDAGAAVGHLAQDAGTSIASGAQRVGHAAAGVGRGVATQARRIQRGSGELYRKNPLAVGAAVLAVGAAVGLAIPRTRLEDEWMGSASDSVATKAQELAHDAMGRVGDAADELADRANAGLHDG